ncbi:unnamed protein product [Polarella glacialis]|uniref:Uncharacterized protein n=2 Tax=Polarella glacialis TaxID=89957 RepID=A0A813GMJ4_POLGL|nr:unnamed protein product [Polarella glacialis]
MHYPVQLGKSSSFASSQKTWMSGILVVQTVLLFCRLFQLQEVIGGFFMGLNVLLGWYAMKKDMNITLVSAWGLVNACCLAYDAFTAMSGVLFSLVQLKFTEVLLTAAMPMSDFLAASFAWEIFKDHERGGGLLSPMFATSSEKLPIFAKNRPDEEAGYGHLNDEITHDAHGEYASTADKIGAKKANKAWC